MPTQVLAWCLFSPKICTRSADATFITFLMTVGARNVEPRGLLKQNPVVELYAWTMLKYPGAEWVAASKLDEKEDAHPIECEYRRLRQISS